MRKFTQGYIHLESGKPGFNLGLSHSSRSEIFNTKLLSLVQPLVLQLLCLALSAQLV